MSVAEVKSEQQPAKKERPPQVAHIKTSTHFNVFRMDEASGPVTRDEQIRAIERFIKFHERQVAVGRQLVAELQAAAAAEARP